MAERDGRDGFSNGGSTPVALAIAGSDSGGGAGIQADLKAFASCGVFGTTAVTAVTAQNTVGVEGVEPVSPSMIEAQVEAVVSDIGVDAVKVGMLGTAQTADAVAHALDLIRGAPVVVDPVMVAESGAALIRDAGDVVEALGIPGNALRGVDAFDRDPESRAVLEAVAEGSSSVDPIAGRTGFPAELVLSILTRLEIEGLVEVSSTGEVVAVPAVS